GHQRVVQRSRNRQGRQGGRQRVRLVLLLEPVGLQHHFGEFFHEQRHPVSGANDLVLHLSRQRFPTSNLHHHLGHLRLQEPTQGLHCMYKYLKMQEKKIFVGQTTGWHRVCDIAWASPARGGGHTRGGSPGPAARTTWESHPLP